MENTFKEITNLLKSGPSQGKENVFLSVLDIILSCTSQQYIEKYFNEEFLLTILKFTGSDTPYSSIIYKILINVFSEDASEQICASKNIMVPILDLTLKDIMDKSCKYADSSCTLLSNITRIQSNCKLISIYLSPISEVLSKIVSVFCIIGYNSECSLDQLAMVLCNLSQLEEIRKVLTENDSYLLKKLIPFMNHQSETRRRGIIGVIHNVAFDTSIHSWMLSDDVDLLPYLLLPLAGPEQFDDEDNEKLPIDLQYLPDTKARELNPDIRKLLIETLNQLCATKFGRQYLRDHNSYIILRELHKWEEHPSVLLACENVVDILIRTEEEIGIDQLKNVEVPVDLEEKLNKVLDLNK